MTSKVHGRICDPQFSSGAVREGCSCWETSLTTTAFWERAAFKGKRIGGLKDDLPFMWMFQEQCTLSGLLVS